jgi:putative FmdB family regulatory protein
VPLYDYVCSACGRRFEVIHGVHADPPPSCPLCGEGPVRKAITAASVHYKGSGWAKKERRAAVKTGSATGSGDESSAAAGSSTSDGGAPASEGGSSEPESSPRAPAAAASGDGSDATSKPSKSDRPSRKPTTDPE